MDEQQALQPEQPQEEKVAVPFNSELPQTEAYQHKPWDELSDAEQTERMRGVIKAQAYEIDSLRKEFNGFRNVLFTHVHSPEGKILSEPRMYGGDGDCIAPSDPTNGGAFF